MLRVWGLGLVEGLGFWVFLVSGFRVRGFRGFVVSGLDKVQGFWFSFLGENEAHHIMCISRAPDLALCRQAEMHTRSPKS